MSVEHGELITHTLNEKSQAMPATIERPLNDNAIAVIARLIYAALREHSSTTAEGMGVEDLQRIVAERASGRSVSRSAFSQALIALMDASLIKWDSSFRITIPR